jgi:16S rRNA (guanine527-N7)-methyltransferase
MASELLNLKNVKGVCKRAEEGGMDPLMREQFDYATARAVAELKILSELTLPYVKVGGELLALKGRNVQFEINDAKKAIATLGGRHTKTMAYTLTNGNSEEDMVHPMVIIAKVNKTPKDYPRVYAKICKKPL